MKEIEIFSCNTLFSEYSEKMMQDVNLLKKVELPTPLIWKVDWNAIDTMSPKPNRRKWSNIPFFRELSKYSTNPAVYYFMIDEVHSESVHTAYRKLAAKKSELRLMNGIKNSGYINFSHIPVEYRSTTCLYAGSVQDKINLRLREHLGYSSGRTGALYLKQALETLSNQPGIIYYAHILPFDWKRIRAHIECVIQDYLQPMIGKRAFRHEDDV